MSPAQLILPPSPGTGSTGLKTQGRLSPGHWPAAADCLLLKCTPPLEHEETQRAAGQGPGDNLP